MRANETNHPETHNPKAGRFGKRLPVALRMALRNLFAHKSKTLIIGTLVALGITLLVTGNSMIDTAEAGIRKNYIDSFTGDLMIRAKAEGEFSLFTTDMNMAMRQGGLPTIADYEKTCKLVSELPGVEVTTPQLVGRGMILREEKILRMLLLFGIDPESYAQTFPDTIEIVKGEFLDEGEEGILISESVAGELQNEDNYIPRIGDRILLAGFSFNGFELKEVTLRGIFRYVNSNELLDRVSLVDGRSFRAMMSMSGGSSGALEIGKEESGLIDTEDFDGLFSGGNIVTETKTSAGDPLALFADDEGKKKSDAPRVSSGDTGLWHFLIIKLADSNIQQETMEKLSRVLKEAGIEAVVMDWRASAGAIGTLSSAVKIVFNVLVLIIAIVAIIIIMNTIVISVTERISEIGTMRALGAKKGFVFRLILTEVMLIVLAFGLLGIALGAAILVVLNQTGIKAANMFFEIIFGGKVLHPVLSIQAMAASLAVIGGIGVLSSLYPIAIALRIQPVRAIALE